MTQSALSETIDRLANRAASAVVARTGLNVPALNAVLARRLAAAPGDPESLFADPVLESARVWEPATCTFGELEGDLLHPSLVAALDEAPAERMPRDRKPYAHQLEAWQAARDGKSFLVTSGTGSGKTECFMIPVLDDLLRNQAKGQLVGIRAIVIYPLNALIESQRERLAAWTVALKDRVRFAMYNGLTPETPRQVRVSPAAAELGDRRSIRETPPSILVTNVTMLEYLLLRAQDRRILERSKGLLRWIVLDEAHSYIGAQAAEMALLLRRVRAAFGVTPEEVRLIATSATISEGPETQQKLSQFVADLAGQSAARARVIEGRTVEAILPAEGADAPLQPMELQDLPAASLWHRLAPHPRLRRLRAAMGSRGISLTEAGHHLFGPNCTHRRTETQTILDLAATAKDDQGARLLPWRAHVFQQALGGIWVCIDPACPHRDPELTHIDSRWDFGALWLRQRDKCLCGAPVFELVACAECGTPHLRAGLEAGASARLIPAAASDIDEFAVDAEPDAENPNPIARDRVLLRPARGTAQDRFVQLDDGGVFDNAPPEASKWIALTLIEDEAARACCDGAAEARLQPLRYGPAFFLGNEVPLLLEALAPPLGPPGLPLGGRRALSFSDSRQGTARLAAKLQQEAERTLARAFLYHAVQEAPGPIGEERAKLEQKLAKYRRNPEDWPDEIHDLQNQLDGVAKPVRWDDLVGRLAQQSELIHFACAVWRERARGGRDMVEDPRKLAAMFLYRELFRRPKIQNNPETMGLLRLAFPRLEERARTAIPSALRQAGVDADGWIGLALAAVDFGFRDRLAVDISPEWMVRWAAPRGGQLQAICAANLAPTDRPEGCRPWPGPRPQPGRPSRLHRLVYSMIGGDWDNQRDQDLAGEVLDALWTLITSTVARDVGRGAWRIDFKHAAAVRVEQAWLCPVTRRVFGYSPAKRSPYDPSKFLTPVRYPLMPIANAGGLAPDQRVAVRDWCATAPELIELRNLGLWTNLHDRVAEYAPFLRAQEHSAQIERPVLQIYEQLFKDGYVNILNCTTTMEMGVDIPNVSLVVNANVPPSASNYRQRVGRAGRRGEAFAFAITFCRDLPWDQVAFAAPSAYLAAPISAPAVRLDSVALVERHVHAALLGSFLRSRPDGFNVQSSIGAFFGATDTVEVPVAPDAPAEAFLTWLHAACASDSGLAAHLTALTLGTGLADRNAGYLAAETAEALDALLNQWRGEHGDLVARADAAKEAEVKAALSNRAKRMRGEFLLGELARRGFIPAYGFPVDVVSFDHLSGHDRGYAGETVFTYGERRGGASRTLDVAIREYAPGAEVVVDGLVHQSEGVLPAWGASADTSRLEDLQLFWECDGCRAFGLARTHPDMCPICDAPGLRWHRTLRPAGFLGRRSPHTGYENLGHVPYQMPRIQAVTAPWQVLPDPTAGRLRADPAGHVVTLSSGPEGRGYAICLACGRAEAETEETPNATPVMPQAISQHLPLARKASEKLVAGYCPGGARDPQRIQRNVRLVHDTHTDVFELQLPAGTSRPAGLALAAALRETLAERLGTDTREIGLGTDASRGPAGEPRLSIYLHDRAAGGAGLVMRLAETEWFKACLSRAVERLNCRQACQHGCPVCVLRPDLNFTGEQLDRPAGLVLATTLLARMDLPDALRVLGPKTTVLGHTLSDWLDRQRRAGGLSGVTLFLHGAPDTWDLAGWSIADLSARLKQANAAPRLVISSAALTDAGLDMAMKLDLHRLAVHAELAHTTVMPMAGTAPILAVVERQGGRLAIAAPSTLEATPGPDWGLGASTVLVQGPAPTLTPMQDFDSERLVAISTGNARLIRLADRLDGPAASFGRAFWKVMASESPLVVAAIKTHGVRSATYTDRYLVTPLNLRLLFEVVNATPGTSPARLTIETARLDRPGQSNWAIFHSFDEDTQRRQVLEALLPSASVAIREKAKTAHARCLTLTLGDGRTILVLLDQGFGGWRAESVVRHDFRADPAAQARALRAAVFTIQAEACAELPMVLEETAA